MSFSFSSFWNLLRIEFYHTKDGIKVLISSLLGSWTLFYVLFTLILSLLGEQFFSSEKHIIFCNSTLLIVGIWISSISLSKLHKKDFPVTLSLPNSYLEHFLKAWIISVFITPIFTIILYMIFSYTIIPILALTPETHVSYTFFNPFSDILWEDILVYLEINAMFMMGSIMFKTYSTLKTLSVFISFLLISIVVTAVSMGFELSHIMQKVISGTQVAIKQPDNINYFRPEYTITIITIMFYIITILKIKEKEVK